MHKAFMWHLRFFFASVLCMCEMADCLYSLDNILKQELETKKKQKLFRLKVAFFGHSL